MQHLKNYINKASAPQGAPKYCKRHLALLKKTKRKRFVFSIAQYDRTRYGEVDRTFAKYLKYSGKFHEK